MFLWGYDPTYVLVILAFMLSLFASFGVKSTFARYSKIKSANGFTGSMAARKILDMNGIGHIRIERISGDLTDHFDPKDGVIRLSDSVYDETSVAAIGVAAHEAGHAVQHATKYKPIVVRNSIVPIVNISNALSMPLFFIGFLMGNLGLAYAGALLFSAVLIFQLVTLPVELNASNRAIKILEGSGMLYDEEVTGAKKVLKAAAMTYVAATASTALQLLRLLLLVRGRDD